jgi:hypothetical protein
VIQQPAIQVQTVSILRQETQLPMVLAQPQLLRFIHISGMLQVLVLEHPTTQRCTITFGQDRLLAVQPLEILHPPCIRGLEMQVLTEHLIAA